MKTAVAIALYNGERFLLKQLDSIRMQTKKPDQVVLCDDGSSDNTVSMVRSYIREHQLQGEWTLVINEKNLGYARNFFQAMSLCDADLVFLADQDDIWKLDKIERLAEIMEERPDISLLSCRFEIMNAEDQIMHGLMARRKEETFAINPVTNKDLLRAFYWLGMLMCVRRTFLQEMLSSAKDLPIAHDRILSHCAADRGQFYEYDYVGAYHRRHDNNTAREEHRIAKLLDLPKKIKEIEITRKLWNDILQAEIPLSETSRQQIRQRLALLEKRDMALRGRSLSGILQLYRKDRGMYLRKVSMLCDIWLVMFGKSKH